MPLPDVPHPRVPSHSVRKLHPYASVSRRLLINDIKLKAPDLEDALDELKIVSMRFEKRGCGRIVKVLSFVEDSILMTFSHLEKDGLNKLEEDLVKYTKWLNERFEEERDAETYRDIVASFEAEQAYCHSLDNDTSKRGIYMIAWVLNKHEHQGYPAPWKHATSSALADAPSSSAHSLEHRLTSRQKKVYYDC